MAAVTENKKEVSVIHLIFSIIYWSLTLATVMLIFMLSSDDANDSANFTYVFVELINNMAGQQVVDNSTLRVIGHMMEFGCLAFLTFMAFDNTNKISYKTSYAESPMKILQSDNEMNIILTICSRSLMRSSMNIIRCLSQAVTVRSLMSVLIASELSSCCLSSGSFSRYRSKRGVRKKSDIRSDDRSGSKRYFQKKSIYESYCYRIILIT